MHQQNKDSTQFPASLVWKTVVYLHFILCFSDLWWLYSKETAAPCLLEKKNFKNPK